MKAVASSEPHSALQFFLFLFATKHEELAESARSFEDLSKATKETLDSWEKQLISPMKVTLFITTIVITYLIVVSVDL